MDVQKFLFKNVQKLRNKNVQIEPCIKDRYKYWVKRVREEPVDNEMSAPDIAIDIALFPKMNLWI